MLSRITWRPGSALLLLVALCAPAFCSTSWYVNAAAQSPFDGSSFAHGFPTIQQAVNAAQEGDRILVAKGTYTENVTMADRSVSLYGGYAGTDPVTRNPGAYLTTIDGGKNGPALILGHRGASPQTLDGFSIVNSVAKQYNGTTLGGGVHWEAQGTISHCFFQNNQGGLGNLPANGTGGGGIGVIDGPVSIMDCTFTSNTGTGGGIAFLSRSTSTYGFDVERCTFSQNAGTAGAAIYAEGMFNPSRIGTSTFNSNQAQEGGAIHLWDASSITLAGNTFSGNTANPTFGGASGGALAIKNGSGNTVTMNLFTANAASTTGGGMMTYETGPNALTIANNVFIGNSALGNGGIGGQIDPHLTGAGIITSGAIIVNNTIVDSTGSAITLAGTCYIANNIVAYNSASLAEASASTPSGPVLHNDLFSNAGYDYIFVPNQPTGGNISQDPLFVNHSGGDLHLQMNSPCVDAGSTADATTYAGPTDFDGEPRIYGPAVDIGADEAQPYLVFTTQPGNGHPDQPLSVQPVVTIEDRAGNTLSQQNGPVTLAITPGTGADGAILSGGTTASTAGGIATFAGVTVNQVARGYTLSASAPGMGGGASLPFDVLYQRNYVKPDGSNALDGSTWATAKATIPAAFDLTGGPGGEVWVASGTYTGNILVPTGVTLYGGFKGGETDLGQRNTHVKTTIIDAGGAGSGLRFSGSSDNGVDNFKITGGTGALVDKVGSPSHREGGGIYVANASPRITNNLVMGNSATYGGGISVSGGHPLIEDNVLTQNTAAPAGTVAGEGGGLALGGTPVVADNFIYSNTATGTSPAGAGGAFFVSGSADIHNNTMVGNQSASGQGDILITSGSPHFANNIILNHAAIEKTGGTPTFSHNDYVPGLAVNNPLPNPKGTDGNISQSVTFVNASIGNYHLPSDSFLIDQGDNSAVLPDETDIDGAARIYHGTVDIGADEVSPAPYTLADVIAALLDASGIQSASSTDINRFDLESPTGVDMDDVLRLARKAAGLEPNP